MKRTINVDNMDGYFKHSITNRQTYVLVDAHCSRSVENPLDRRKSHSFRLKTSGYLAALHGLKKKKLKKIDSDLQL